MSYNNQQMKHRDIGGDIGMRKPDENFKMDGIKGMGPGSYSHTKQFSYSKKVGEDGVPQEVKYGSNKMYARDENGKIIGQANERYDNSMTQEKRMADEKILNDQGHRVLRKKVGEGPEDVKERYKGISKDQIPQFENKFEKEKKQYKPLIPDIENGKFKDGRGIAHGERKDHQRIGY